MAERDLYSGVLRLLLVLLHDFPDFLSEFYFTLCDSIPPRCIQLRNIILSAFPAAIILPDPHLSNVPLESLPDMGPIPPFTVDFSLAFRSGELRGQLTHYLLNRSSGAFLSQLQDKLKVPATEGSPEEYNLTLINTIVMFIGVSTVAQANTRFCATDPGAVALQYLASNLDVEGMYYVVISGFSD